MTKTEEETAAAIACASVTAIVAIVAGKDGNIAIRDVIKILQAIK